MGLSRRGYALHRKARGLSGGSESGVRKALAEGRISLEPDGSIDPGKVDALWARTRADRVPTEMARTLGSQIRIWHRTEQRQQKGTWSTWNDGQIGPQGVVESK